MTLTPYDLNFRHLRAAVAVAQRGSIMAAADEISLSQPAITQGLARLEAMLGHSLFARLPSGMAPTEAGEVLVSRVVLALGHISGAARAIGHRNGPHLARLISMSQIRALVAVARTGSFVSAAEATGLSQPALHNATRDLERLTGITLIERRGRGVAFTAEGRRLAQGFRLATAELEAAISELDSLRGIDSGRITIGAMPLSRVRILPRTVARFFRERPNSRVKISDGPYPELIDGLRQGELDILIGALREPSPGKDVVQEPIFSDQLVIVARADHPLAKVSKPSLDRLAAFPWIMAHQGTPLRMQFEHLFRSQNLPPPLVGIECGSVLAIRSLLLEGDFLTLLSPGQVELEVRTGLLRHIGGKLPHTLRTIALTTRAGWHPTPLQRHFIHALKEICAELDS